MSRFLRVIAFLLIFVLIVPAAHCQKKKSGASALKKQIGAYQKAFFAAAQKVVRAKMKGVNGVEIMQWQQECRAARSGDLTKEMIEQTVLPAFRNICDACWVEPSEVLEGNEKLRASRDALLENAATWDTIATEPVISRIETDPPAPPTLQQVVEQIEFDCILYSYAASPQGRKVAMFNQAQTFSIDLQEARCASATNRYRIFLGLEPQFVDRGLCAVSRDHSKDMCTLGFFSHESPVEGKKSFSQRAERMGVKKAASENIFAGSSDGFAAADAWFHSPGHHKNMLNDNPRMGVGRFEKHYTQMTGWSL
ncbi:MAG: CAP domain-containing protein [Planctomycetia bacterium]|nr:CAP domain-containing protein [Planctomycetia bacterium]